MLKLSLRVFSQLLKCSVKVAKLQLNLVVIVIRFWFATNALMKNTSITYNASNQIWHMPGVCFPEGVFHKSTHFSVFLTPTTQKMSIWCQKITAYMKRTHDTCCMCRTTWIVRACVILIRHIIYWKCPSYKIIFQKKFNVCVANQNWISNLEKNLKLKANLKSVEIYFW